MICVPLQTKSEKELIKLMKQAQKKGAQALEIWLDHLATSCVGETGTTARTRSSTAARATNLKAIKKATNLPLIFVNKPKREKGKFTGSEEERIEILQTAAKVGKWVDIGIDTDPKLIRDLARGNRGLRAGSKKRGLRHGKPGPTTETQLILSYHNFKLTPRLATLKKTFKAMKKHRPAVYKFAVTPKRPSDVIRMLEFLKWVRGQKKGARAGGDVRMNGASSFTSERVKYVVICMGPMGEFLRQISEALGNEFTYVALDAKHRTAPGQLTL